MTNHHRQRGSALLFVIAALLLISCAQAKPATQDGANPALQQVAPQAITPEEYQARFGSGETAHFLLDVRTSEEFASGHIAGATNIAVETLAQQLGQVPKDQPVIVYCHSGNRSARAAQLLQEAGYTQIYDLGGVVQWQAAGYPLQ